MKPSDKKPDNLQKIDHIGPARAEWLEEMFHVHTFQEVAELSPEEIEAKLKGERKSLQLDRSKIEQSLARAKELSEQAIETPKNIVETERGEDTPSETDQLSSPSEQLEELEAEDDSIASTSQGEWKPFATFVVEYQAQSVVGQTEEQRIKVHHMETDMGEVWPGHESNRLEPWIQKQVEQRGRTKLDNIVTESEPDDLSGEIEVTHLKIFQPPDARIPLYEGRTGQPCTDRLISGRPFALEVKFNVGQMIMPDDTLSKMSYHAEIDTYNLATGERIPLGETLSRDLIRGRLAYSATLPTAALLQGAYQLRTQIKIHSSSTKPGLLEVPFLQVM